MTPYDVLTQEHIDNLRAENERLQIQVDAERWAKRTIATDYERVSAENERLTQLLETERGVSRMIATEHKKEVADNERLHEANASLRLSVENLRSLLAQSPHAEIERLRAALSEITDLELEGGEASLVDAMTIADEALNPPPSQT